MAELNGFKFLLNGIESCIALLNLMVKKLLVYEETSGSNNGNNDGENDKYQEELSAKLCCSVIRNLHKKENILDSIK